MDAATGRKRGRRTLARLAAGGALAALIAVGLVALMPESGDTAALVVSPAAAGSPPLDGYRIGYVPDGALEDPRDGSSECLVTPGMRECREPRSGDPTATVSLRRYDKAGSAWMWITVLRPQGGDRAHLTRALIDWQTYGATQVTAFDAPVGRARVLATTGSEVTVHSAVITTADGVVITISGTAELTVADLTHVAQHVTPSR